MIRPHKADKAETPPSSGPGQLVPNPLCLPPPVVVSLLRYFPTPEMGAVGGGGVSRANTPQVTNLHMNPTEGRATPSPANPGCLPQVLIMTLRPHPKPRQANPLKRQRRGSAGEGAGVVRTLNLQRTLPLDRQDQVPFTRHNLAPKVNQPCSHKS